MIKIRSLARIDKFTAEFNRIWKKYFPDWRYCQLMMNFLGWIAHEKKLDPFFIEENNFKEKYVTYPEYLDFLRLILKRDFGL